MMKKIFFSVLIITLIISLQNSSSAIAQNKADITYIRIRVDGLSCPFCAYGLEKKLKKVDGAANLHIELEEGIVTLEVPKDKKPTAESLKKVVTDAGFTPREIKFSDIPFKEKDEDNK